jgi:hypothetical protein
MGSTGLTHHNMLTFPQHTALVRALGRRFFMAGALRAKLPDDFFTPDGPREAWNAAIADYMTELLGFLVTESNVNSIQRDIFGNFKYPKHTIRRRSPTKTPAQTPPVNQTTPQEANPIPQVNQTTETWDPLAEPSLTSAELLTQLVVSALKGWRVPLDMAANTILQDAIDAVKEFKDDPKLVEILDLLAQTRDHRELLIETRDLLVEVRNAIIAYNNNWKVKASA